MMPRHMLDPKKVALVQEVEVRMQDLCKLIDSLLPEGVGFALITFTYGDNGYATYGSSAKREEMVQVLRDCADTVEAKMDAPRISQGGNA